MERKLRLKVIACGVFEDELRAIAAKSPNELDVQLLDAGLHAAPEKLRLRAQEAIDEASRSGGYDAVCFAYGLCGRGTAGLIARDVPLVVPRVHDCISLFLGSARAYAEQSARHPGTFYFTTGWYKHKAHPETTRLAAAREFNPAAHPHFREFAERFGEDNARYIVQFLESWRRNYRRAALIDDGFATAEQEEATKAVAEAAGWSYERLQGSLALLEALASGAWDEGRFLVVPPGHVAVVTNDERILAAVRLERSSDIAAGEALVQAEAAHQVDSGVFFYGQAAAADGQAAAADAQADVGLGIDAGGTYTDAVLYEFATGAVLGKAKAITTHRDLVEGIREALWNLDASLFGRISYTCLSTTLATNAIVEGQGRPVGLILMPYESGLARQVRMAPFRCLSARMTIEGLPEAPVDGDEVLAAAAELVREGAASFAVSGYGSVRNPEHELQVRQILEAHYDVPIVCGHELSARLNFVQRAHTAVLNARLLPLVTDLLRSVEEVLADAGIAGPLFVVRGDGSLMAKEAARARAIETVLSGPAASAAGGRLLSGCADALVVDIGGTTTDIAALADGSVRLSSEGAQVGLWRTSVTAADIQTTGLGGDSAVRPIGRRGVVLGPERAVPLSFLAVHWPAVMDELSELNRRQSMSSVSPEECDFFVLVRRPMGLALEPDEERILDLLGDGPRSRPALSTACGCLAPQLLRARRLELAGAVRRAGVTPTDALHVLGEFCAFNGDAARLALRLLGHFLGLSEEETARLVKREVERRLALAIMRRELTDAGINGPLEDFERLRDLFDRVLEGKADAPFRLSWHQSRTVVGIGAPVAAFLPGACRALGAEPVIPAHAEVANALGAVASQVMVAAQARIRPGQFGSYVLYGPGGRAEFAGLKEAEGVARRQVVELLRSRARRFGTAEERVRVEVSRRVGRLQDGSTQLLEVEVAGSLAGRPALKPVAPS